jgi:hypothetical protein
MSAIEALKAARAVGVELALDGDDVVLSAASAPPAAVLDALSRHKTEIVGLLRPGCDGWSAEDWQVSFDERAGIIEFDGGLPRAEAEARAFDCCVVEWLNRNPDAGSALSLSLSLPLRSANHLRRRCWITAITANASEPVRPDAGNDHQERNGKCP